MQRTKSADAADREFETNAGSSGRRNPDPRPRYDLVILGGGPAGLAAARRGLEVGATVALVERDTVGGSSLLCGSVPSKALVRAARLEADARDSHLYAGTPCPDRDPDLDAALSRMRRLRARLSRADSVRMLEAEGVHVFFGEGRFTGPAAIDVRGRALRFRRALIATGARPKAPAIDGLEEAGYFDDESVFGLTEPRKRWLVIGGGPLGCELAQAFHRLGSEVTIVQRDPQFLPREERDAAQILSRAFARDGIAIHLNAEAVLVRKIDHEKRIRVRGVGGECEFHVDEILVGVGRRPNVDGMDLDRAGVDFDLERGIHVDGHLRTTRPAIYASGDVCLESKFTHMAEASARLAVENALLGRRRRMDDVVVPWCTFTDPEIAHVGLYTWGARDRGIPAKSYTVPMSDVHRAVLDGEHDGFVKILVRDGTDTILGATIVGRHAGEIISEITLAMVAGIGLRRIADVVHPYPTKALAIQRAAEACRRELRRPPRARKKRPSR